MCFSATASFTASAGLGIVGFMTVTKVKDIRTLPMAALPLWFSLQQFIEGWLWVYIPQASAYVLPLTALYLFFALFWWPFYGPISNYIAEVVPWRRKVTGLFTLSGLALGTYLYANFLMHPAPATILHECVYYRLGTPNAFYWGIVYILITVGAGLFSSQKVVNLFSGLIGLFAFVAWRLYTVDFVSVWCFFAAAISLSLYFYIALPHAAVQRWQAAID